MSDVVRGRVVLDPSTVSLERATLRVIVEETTHADAPAREVARVELLPGQALAGTPVEFDISVPRLNPNARYEVRAHLDQNGSGAFSPGDQITMESHPVLTKGFPNDVNLRLRSI